MKKYLWLLALVVLAAGPVHAGVGFAGHAGGGFSGAGFRGGGFSSGFHSFSRGRGCGFYGGGFGYGYGYAPFFGYASYPIGYDSGYYGASVDPTAYSPADTAQPASQTTNPAAAPTGPLPAGKIDDFGFVHSPFSTTTFKAAKVTDGQVFFDPTTGQPFMVHVTPPTSVPAPAVPSATTLPTGKLDEFGYVHSPFSTFTFKVQNGNYAQAFRDPFTGQSFAVTVAPAATTVASAKPNP